MEKDIKVLEGLEIFLGYACNVRCSFCYQKDLRSEHPKNISYDEVVGLIRQGYESGKRFVIFSGGEPTLDKNLPQYIQFAKEIGYTHIRLHTNGWALKDEEYVRELYQRGVTGVIISIHGYGEIHDRITGVKGSFDIIVKALIHLQKIHNQDATFVFDTNTVLCKTNVHFLEVLFHFLLKFSISRRMLVYPYNIGLSHERLKKILPLKKDYIIEVERVSDMMKQYNIRDFVLETIPYCILKNLYWDFIEKNYKTDKDTYFITGKTQKNEQYYNGKIKFEECGKCVKNEICAGFSQDYYDLYGKPDFNIL